MSGKEHMIVGTTATTTMGIGFLLTNNISNIKFLFPLIIGGFIGSYMPDIDSQNSKARKFFNKFIVFLIIALVVGYTLGMALNISDIIILFEKHGQEYFPIIFFTMLVILGKLSPHRMFTHKWFGTTLFCFSVYTLGNTYLTVGFTMGYVLHIVCDRFSPRGKKLKFFEFKLPCRNSKNKITVTW